MRPFLLHSITVFIALSLLIPTQARSQDPNFYIYLCFGQSNMAGAGEIETMDLNVDSRFQFMKPQDCAANKQYSGNWYSAVPPLWGCSGGIGPADYFGRTMLANLPANVRIGVVNVSVPGSDIAIFGKTGFAGFDTYNYVPSKYGGSAYAWLLDLAKQAQKLGVVKGILLHQGENNTGQATWPSKVKTVYDNLITDLGLTASQTPLLVGELLYQNQGGVCWSHNAIIATVPSVIPHSYVISADALPGKDIYHFNSAGNRTFGIRYAQKMLSLLPSVPSVSIASPTPYSTYSAPATILITASASDTKAGISKVEFYNGTTKIGEDASSPYSLTWINVGVGIYPITAVATNNAGAKSTSAIDTIRVNPAQAPYGGTPAPVPGTIQFENYDIGGNGFAYNDASVGNTGGALFRTDEDVDIEVCTDTGTGYNIGFATAGEWLEYTVNVAKAGKYDISLRVACKGDGRTVSLNSDGAVLAKDIAVPNTADWQTWSTVTVPDISLKAGVQVIRLTVGAVDYVNLNYMTVREASLPTFALQAGWNLIGCPLKGSTDVTVALSSILSNVEAVKNQDCFYIKSQPLFLNTLPKLEWGEGYWIKTANACLLQW